MLPVYVAGFLVVISLLIWLYNRMTLGICSYDEDITGKTVLITGATEGIGKATALGLARRNARVILACRNLTKAEKVRSEIASITGNTNVEIKHLDLESFDSVRKCAASVLKTEKRLDVLINNAGILQSELELTEDGYEKCMQVNHLSHFLLTLLLLDLLKSSFPSRIINVSSMIHLVGILDVDDMNGKETSFWLRSLGNFYCRSKLANVLFTEELASRLAGTGVTVNAVHPGLVKSELYFKCSPFYIMHFLTSLFGKTNEEGAQTSIYLAVHPEVENVSGELFMDCHQVKFLKRKVSRKMSRKLFEVSEKIVGTSYRTL